MGIPIRIDEGIYNEAKKLFWLDFMSISLNVIVHGVCDLGYVVPAKLSHKASTVVNL